jgi:hypothetical protein
LASRFTGPPSAAVSLAASAAPDLESVRVLESVPVLESPAALESRAVL